MVLPTNIAAFWGKASPPDGCPEPVHSLVYHALDVAAVFEALLETWTDSSARLMATFDAPSDRHQDIVRTLTSLVALHDVGKFAWAFQAKVLDHLPAVFAKRAAPHAYRHDSGGLALFDTDRRLQGILEPLLAVVSDRNAILDPTFLHHGRVRDVDRDIMTDFRPEGLEAARAFALEIVTLFGAAPLPRLQRGSGPAVSWRLAGLVALADWLGSNTDWFPYQAPGLALADYLDQIARPNAQKAIAKAGLAPARTSTRGGFHALTGRPAEVEPTGAQRWAESVPLADGAGLYVIEDAMGSGKTEAALVLAHRLLQAGQAEGLFVALPTMATANALFDRLAEVHRRLFEDAANPSLALAHSAAALHPGFRRALDAGLRDEPGYGGDASDATAWAQCSSWIADDRRRTFFADVGVGTIDQALMAVLPATHAAMRQLGLSRRVLIVDEAHAYDAYMREELATLIEFQAALGGSAIILSATLPASIKAKLAAAFQRGRTGSRTGGNVTLATTDYPLATAIGAAVEETPVALRTDLARTIAVQRVDGPEDAHRRIVAHAAAGAAVVYIRNTVDDVLDTVAALKALGIDAMLFHARFALGDRLKIEQNIIKTFGRDSTPEIRRGRVLVATQVVEQSLDLDFDAMLTDLAPIDLMIQRAGRLWRHNHRAARPLAEPVLEVVSPDPVPDPAKIWFGAMFPRGQWVYEDHAVLWLSAHDLFARGALGVPDDLRPLIEGVYAGDRETRIPAGLMPSANTAEGKDKGAAGIAVMNVLKFRDGFQRGTAHVWQDDLDIPTRLSQPTTTFRLARWDGRILRPWCDDADEHRAWRLSEVSVRATRAVARAPGSPAEAAAAEIESVWRRRHDNSILLPINGTSSTTVLDERGRVVPVHYEEMRGLMIG
jgi:CRISPR-associated endonuclease/helicase Cas3